MASVTHHQGHPRFMDRGELSRAEVEELAEFTSKGLLGVTMREALDMLDRGLLNGKAAESSIRALRRLLSAK